MVEIGGQRLIKVAGQAVRITSVVMGWTPYRRQIAFQQCHNGHDTRRNPHTGSVEEGGYEAECVRYCLAHVLRGY